MADHFHDVADLRLLKQMEQLAPEEFKAWLNLDSIVKREDGAIPRKFRELIAVAVACTTQCPYCVEVHSKAAKATGASREELVEAAERSASSPIYPLLKRTDERYVTMQAYDNPVFVEDVVRNVANLLRLDERITWFEVRVTNHESIHNHAAFAVLRQINS